MPQLKDSIYSNIGDYECQLLETLDKIKGVRQAYDRNVFIGNHCKIILNNYEKLCDLVSDEPEFMSIYPNVSIFIQSSIS